MEIYNELNVRTTSLQLSTWYSLFMYAITIVFMLMYKTLAQCVHLSVTVTLTKIQKLILMINNWRFSMTGVLKLYVIRIIITLTNTYLHDVRIIQCRPQNSKFKCCLSVISRLEFVNITM